LENIRIHGTLAEALAPYSFANGTTARTGGWRQGIQTPEEAAPRIVEQRNAGGTIWPQPMFRQALATEPMFSGYLGRKRMTSMFSSMFIKSKG